MFRYITVVLMNLMLFGCGIMKDPENPIHDRRDEYTQVKAAQPLRYPADIKAPQTENEFPVPEVEGSLTVVSLTPPGSLAERVNIDERGGKPVHTKLVSKKIRIQEQDGQLVMLLNESISSAADAIESALRKQKIKLLNVDRQRYAYLVSNGQQKYILQLISVNQNYTRIELRDQAGKTLNQEIAMNAFNQLSDGLKGNPNSSLYERIFG